MPLGRAWRNNGGLISTLGGGALVEGREGAGKAVWPGRSWSDVLAARSSPPPLQRPVSGTISSSVAPGATTAPTPRTRERGARSRSRAHGCRVRSERDARHEGPLDQPASSPSMARISSAASLRWAWSRPSICSDRPPFRRPRTGGAAARARSRRESRDENAQGRRRDQARDREPSGAAERCLPRAGAGQAESSTGHDPIYHQSPVVSATPGRRERGKRFATLARKRERGRRPRAYPPPVGRRAPAPRISSRREDFTLVTCSRMRSSALQPSPARIAS